MEGQLWSDVLGITLCLAGSAFFSGTETALTSLGAARTQQLIEQGGRGGRALERWAQHPLETLVAILIWNNLVNITASALATHLAEKLLGAVGAGAFISPMAIAVGVMTFLLLTFGEITPKTLAKANARRWSPTLMQTLRPFALAVHPFTIGFVTLTRTVSRLTGANPDEDALHRERDIEALVRMADREGSLSEDREMMLLGAFDADAMLAREVMVPRIDVVGVSIDTPLADLVELLVDCGHSRIPVYESSIDHVVGLLYAKDLLRLLAGPYDTDAFSLATLVRPVKLVPDSTPVSVLFREMQEERIHMSIVTDEYGGMRGIVTLEDVMELYFGDIQDEFDKEDEYVQPLGDGLWRLDARIPIDDVADLLDVDPMEEADFDTLGGFIATQLGELPKVGATIESWGARFTVVEADERRIRRVRVERTSPLPVEWVA